MEDKEKPTKDKQKLSKKTVIIVIVVCVLVIAAVVSIFVWRAHQADSEPQYDDKVITSYSERDSDDVHEDTPDPVNTITNTELQTQTVSVINMDDTGEYVRKEHGKYVLYVLSEEDNGSFRPGTEYDGLYYITIKDISSSPQLYYFTSGILNTKYKGMVQYMDKLFYVRNGKVDYDYNGFCKYNGYTWYIRNGMIQNNYNGKAAVNGKTYYINQGSLE